MNSVVIDPALALALIVEGPLTPAARAAIAGADPLVPDLFWNEVASALAQKVRDGEIDGATAIDGMAALQRLVERTVPTAPLAGAALRMSLQTGRPVPECLYPAAAAAHRAPLARIERWARDVAMA